MRGAEEVQVVGPTTDVCADFVGVLVNEGTKSVGLISFPLFRIISSDAAAKFSAKDFFFFSLRRQGKHKLN